MKRRSAVLAVCTALTLPAGAQHVHEADAASAAEEHLQDVELPHPPGDPPTAPEEPRIAIEVPPEQIPRIGLKLAPVVRRPLRHRLLTLGTVGVDERREAHVHTRFAGWIEEIRVSYVGQRVRKGETLCLFYSPELVTIQDEYLAARGRGVVGAQVARAALERLRLLGVPEREIERLERGEKRRLLVPIDSPIGGYVVARQAVQGMYVMPELQLYHIADISRVWIFATLYEVDLPFVEEGDEAEVTLTYEPERRFRGQITYIYPDVDVETRTVHARLEVDNEALRLKPGMYVNVAIEKDLGERLVVPESAVIDTGVRKLVFAHSPPSRFDPREVELGARVGDFYEVRSGLAEGEQVVTGANFLIDAESRLQAALQRGLGAPTGHEGH